MFFHLFRPYSEEEAMHLDDEMFSGSLDGFHTNHTKDTRPGKHT